MMLLHLLQFIVIYSFIKLFVLCEFTTSSDEEYVNVNSLNENSEEENYVLDSVYDTMKNNYEMRMRQNLNKLNLISDIRNKRNINEISTPSSMEVYKNHHQHFDVNRKTPMTYPLGFKNPSKYLQIVNPSAAVAVPVQQRSDRSEYEYEEYTKCHEKPTVQTFHISDHKQDEGKHHLPEISGVLLTGLKYLLGGFAILALPFIVLKALLLPLKFLFFIKAFALTKSVFLFTLFLRFLRLQRRLALLNGGGVVNPVFPFGPFKNKQKLQTIKDILNSQDMTEEDMDYDKSEDESEVVLSKENSEVPMMYDNNLNQSEIGEEIVQNLVKLIKLKNKNW